MLLDEPLSNLDPKLRETMRFEIKELQRKFNLPLYLLPMISLRQWLFPADDGL